VVVGVDSKGGGRVGGGCRGRGHCGFGLSLERARVTVGRR